MPVGGIAPINTSYCIIKKTGASPAFYFLLKEEF
jgi:hypothetical protein